MSNRSPFDFASKIKVAKMYLDDGAYLTCADRLEALAKSIREGVAASEARHLKSMSA